MTDIVDLELTVAESPVPAALDALYDFVRNLGAPGAGEAMSILGSVTAFDIHAQARLYNSYVIRAFADRTVRSSPGSGLGLGDTAERYSELYLRLLFGLLVEFDSSLSHEARERIQLHRLNMQATARDRDAYLRGFERDWAEQMKIEGIDLSKIDSDPAVARRYVERRIIFAKQRRFAETLREYNFDIEREQLAIDVIRDQDYPDDEARQIVRLFSASERSRIIRPRRWELELEYKWNELSIQNPDYANMPDIFDIGVHIDSIVDPRVVLNSDGTRGFSVRADSEVTNAHDAEWRVSGSARKLLFFKSRFQTTNSESFRQSISKIRKVEMSFANVALLDITRGGWFSRSIFAFERVQRYLKKYPDIAQSLALVTSSLLVGRGLTLKLYFRDRSDLQSWGSTSMSAGAGLSLFGWNMGSSGGGSSVWNNRKTNEEEQTVTFEDAKGLCRLLGVRASEVMPAQSRMEFDEIAQGFILTHDLPLIADAALQRGPLGS